MGLINEHFFLEFDSFKVHSLLSRIIYMQFSPDVLTIKILEVLAQNMCVYFQILLTSP